jgi:biopolymer transport protein ExbB
VLELIKAGGWAMWPILACSMLTLGIVLERFWALRRKAVMPRGLSEEVQAWAANRKPDPQHLDALAATSPLGTVLAAALRARPFGREAMRERIEDAGRHVMHDLERFLNTLGTIALISPLMGLLGTVSGMIRMFLSIMANGVGDAGALAGGIGESLVCTEAGLVVAVPAYIFHRLLRGRVHGYGIAMEREVIALVDSIERPAAAVTPAPAPAPAPARRAAR